MSYEVGLSVLGPIPTKWKSTIASRVLKDVFHMFNMFYILVVHGLRVEFARALQNALLIPYLLCVYCFNLWAQAQNPPTTFKECMRLRPAWVLQFIRRIIPPPDQLYPAAREVYKKYGPLKDKATGMPLFNHTNWKVAKNILELIYNGYLSDPPGVGLYAEMGEGKTTRLPVWRCLRAQPKVGCIRTFDLIFPQTAPQSGMRRPASWILCFDIICWYVF